MLLDEIASENDNPLLYKKLAEFLIKNDFIKFIERPTWVSIETTDRTILYSLTEHKKSIPLPAPVEQGKVISARESYLLNSKNVLQSMFFNDVEKQNKIKEFIKNNFPHKQNIDAFVYFTLLYIVAETILKNNYCVVVFLEHGKPVLETPLYKFLKRYYKFVDITGSGFVLYNERCFTEEQIKKMKNPEQAAKKIYKDCQYFLNLIDYQVDDFILYRGFRKKQGMFFRYDYTRRKNRKPDATSQIIHDFMNEVFEQLFGWKVRNGVFATGSYDEAKYYNPLVNMIFPIGEFKYVWSPKYKDFFYSYVNKNFVKLLGFEDHEDFEYFVRRKYKSLYDFLQDRGQTQIIQKIIKDIKTNFTDKNFKQAIKSNHEIVLSPHKGYAVLYGDYGKEVLECLKKLINSKK